MTMIVIIVMKKVNGGN